MTGHVAVVGAAVLPSPEKVAEALELMAETMVVLRAKLVVVGDDGSASREGERAGSVVFCREREEKRTNREG